MEKDKGRELFKFSQGEMLNLVGFIGVLTANEPKNIYPVGTFHNPRSINISFIEGIHLSLGEFGETVGLHHFVSDFKAIRGLIEKIKEPKISGIAFRFENRSIYNPNFQAPLTEDEVRIVDDFMEDIAHDPNYRVHISWTGKTDYTDSVNGDFCQITMSKKEYSPGELFNQFSYEIFLSGYENIFPEHPTRDERAGIMMTFRHVLRNPETSVARIRIMHK